MADLNADEQAVADAIERHQGSGYDWATEAQSAITALDLPGRDAAIRSDERAQVRAELLAIAHERTHGHGELFYEGHYLTGIADRIAPAPDQPEERT